MKSNTITFASNATTLEALKLTFVYAFIFLLNIAKAINRFAHRFPWVCIILVMVLCGLYSFIEIGKARAERDSYNKENAQLQMKVDSYTAVYEK